MSKLILALFILLPISTLLEASPDIFINDKDIERVVVGEAFDIKNNVLLYREFHYYSNSDMNHRVIYRDPLDHLMVTKDIRYHTGLVTPEYSLTVANKSEKVSVVWYQGQLKFQRNDENFQLLKVSEPLVVDAGFDHYIRDNWKPLSNGETLEFYFPLVKRSTMAKLRVKSEDCTYSSVTDICYRLEVSNWLLRLLVSPIELGYNRDSKLLSRYRGLSNIEDDNGDGMVVDIHYHYKDKI